MLTPIPPVSTFSGLRHLMLLAGVLVISLLSSLQGHSQTLYLLTEDGRLATVSATAATAPSTPVTITGVTAGETLVAIDVRPQNQQLYALGVNATTDRATLYIIEPSTAFASPVGTATGLITFTTNGTTAVDFVVPTTVKWEMDFNPTVDRLRVVAGTLNFRVVPGTGLPVDGDNGSATAVTGTNPDAAISGLTTTISAAAYTNNRPNSTVTTQYTLDDASNGLLIQNLTTANAGAQINGLPVTLGGSTLDFSQASFDIDTNVDTAASNTGVASGIGYIVAKTTGLNSSLYSINLVNAQATLLGDTGLAVRGAAIRTLLGTAVALNSAGNSLLRFDPASPANTTSVSVTGVNASEVLVAIDSRPQTGQLYGLGINHVANTGTLYLLDRQAGTATAVGATGSITLVDGSAVAIDFLDPATNGYGFDFNPTTDRIRVVTSNGINFQINPSTGAPVDGNLGGPFTVAGTNPDAPLNGPSTAASGAAFTNNVAQNLTSTATTLYTMDAVTGTLYILNPQSSGTQTTPVQIRLGTTPLTISRLNGFDIPPGVTVATANAVASGFGWFSGTVGATTSLYRVDLTTGAATLIGPIGTGTVGMSGLVVNSTAPDIVVENPTNTPVADNASTIAFGTTFVGTPLTATVTLRNFGSQPLTYSTSLNSNTSFKATGNAAGTIPAFSSTVLTVTFNPLATGPLTDTLRILSDDPDMASFRIALTGTGFISLESDAVTRTTGTTRIYPLANDSLTGNLVITSVSDPAILISGRSLILPSGYAGTFTYTVSNGTDFGRGTVTVTAGTASLASTSFNGVLLDSTGKVSGWASASTNAFGTGSLRVVCFRGSASSTIRFIGANSTSQTSVGVLALNRSTAGVLSASLALNGGGTLTGLLRANVLSTPAATYHVELSSIDPSLAGGGYATIKVGQLGAVQINGILPDGNPFSASTNRTDNAAIAFYSIVGLGVRPTGLVGGELTIANNAQTDISGELVWSKPAQGVGATGTELAGVDTTLTVNGSLFDARVPIYSGFATVQLIGGNLAASESNVRLITSGIVPVPTGSIQSWKTSTFYDGRFTFSVAVPGRSTLSSGGGVYLQKSKRAVGYFPGTTKGGRVVLTPSAP